MVVADHATRYAKTNRIDLLDLQRPPHPPTPRRPHPPRPQKNEPSPAPAASPQPSPSTATSHAPAVHSPTTAP